MQFIKEACHRRPVEPLGLVYSRGATAITMGCLFIAFCGFLISKICNDEPLLQISSEYINGDFSSPDISLCASNTSISIVKCSAMYVDWHSEDIPNCWERFFRPGANDDVSKCFMFETNGTFRMGTSIGMEAVNKTSLIRLDFYWNIDSIVNMSYATNSIPAITVQLYDPSFSTWKTSTFGNSPMEKKTADNIDLGLTRATSYMGYSSSIFYQPQKYREIRPGDASTLFGLKSKYIDIMTLVSNQHNWPLQIDPKPPNSFDVELFQGMFSVQLSQSTIDVKTEVMQYTFLSSIALAGGCYGVLTTIYMLLFGMTRLTPWGIVHHIPVFINKHAHNIKIGKQQAEENLPDDMPVDEGFAESAKSSIAKKKSAEYSSVERIPWFFKNATISTADVLDLKRKSLDKIDTTELQLLDNKTDNFYGKRYSQSKEPQSPTTPRLPSYSNSIGNINGMDLEIILARVHDALKLEQDRSNELQETIVLLSDRVMGLEFILTEYFIDTKYMDKLNFKRDKASSSEDDEV